MSARRRRWLTVAALLLVFALPAGRRAWAHDESVSSSEVDITADQVVWKVDVGVAGLAKVLSLPAAEGELDEAGLRSVESEIATYVAGCLDVSADGTRLSATPTRLEPQYEPGLGDAKPLLGRMVQTLVFHSARPISEVHAKVAIFADITTQHRALIRVKWESEARRFVRLGPTALVLSRGHLAAPWWSLAWEFGRWGTHHIFIGYDHLAFLLALLLAVTRFRDLLKIVTSFTLAHSLTLLLSALDALAIPSRITEVLIAASIVYVALENLRSAGRPLRYRWVVTFVFGLVHGLGLAGELRNRLSELQGHVLVPALCFNVGVEVGQVVIVALVFPLLTRLRRGSTDQQRAFRQRRLVRMGSVPILLLGIFWMIQRM